MMKRESLQLSKAPNGRSKAANRLQSSGLAFEYFPTFTQKAHDFHTHDFVEILFVFKGTFRHVTADRTYDESAGGLTVLNYNQFHTMKTPAGPVELMNIYWDLRKYFIPDLPDPFFSRLHELIPNHPMLGHRLNRVFHLQMNNPEKVGQLLRMLYNEQQHESEGSAAAMDALFRVFLIELCRAATVDTEASTENFNSRMETVRRYLDAHYAEPIRLEQLCKLSDLKDANLCRQFKKYTGLSTGDYLKQRRLDAAMQKLRGTNEKILTICHACGFSDIANFNRTFRAVLRKTPSEYRKSAG